MRPFALAIAASACDWRADDRHRLAGRRSEGQGDDDRKPADDDERDCAGDPAHRQRSSADASVSSHRSAQCSRPWP